MKSAPCTTVLAWTVDSLGGVLAVSLNVRIVVSGSCPRSVINGLLDGILTRAVYVPGMMSMTCRSVLLAGTASTAACTVVYCAPWATVPTVRCTSAEHGSAAKTDNSRIAAESANHRCPCLTLKLIFAPHETPRLSVAPTDGLAPPRLRQTTTSRMTARARPNCPLRCRCRRRPQNCPSRR